MRIFLTDEKLFYPQRTQVRIKNYELRIKTVYLTDITCERVIGIGCVCW